MGAGGDFRDYAAEWAVCLILPDDGLGKNLPVRGDERSRAVVA